MVNFTPLPITLGSGLLGGKQIVRHTYLMTCETLVERAKLDAFQSTFFAGGC